MAADKVTDSQYELAECYKEEEILWNISHAEYYNRIKRKDALIRIGAIMGLQSKYHLFHLFISYSFS